ncbi:hypothetical protein ACLIBG_03960 [Virgibacillus sp. W0181]|uniref:hypothetical protein n=1 Tax=Virgibacillus sp. W0181 TaxID=3391581 RepID=UPI003F47053C
MEELFQFITSNFIMFVIIIGGLISLFRNKQTGEQQSKQRPSNIPETRSQTQSKQEEVRDNWQLDERMQESIETMTSEEQREKQLERLKSQVNANSHMNRQRSNNASKDVQDNHKSFQPLPESTDRRLSDSKQDDHFKKKIKGQLNRGGLLESIVMAEVLGSPRSLKPYRSKIYDRQSF